MDKPESLADFYQQKLNWMPEQIRNEIGHFNVFRLEPFTGDNAKPVPYKRRDFYKIMLVVGNSKVHYADKVVEVQKQALSFFQSSNSLQMGTFGQHSQWSLLYF